MAKITPMMEQYFAIKEQYKHCLLFFRLGDFYEMFFEDAVIASKELEITLTGKDWGQEERAPMCGVPFHSADGYIARLVEKGYHVAICEQVEDPKQAKGIVKREVIRVITPGTVLDHTVLDESKNNYIMSTFGGKNGYGLSVCDVSTGNSRQQNSRPFWLHPVFWMKWHVSLQRKWCAMKPFGTSCGKGFERAFPHCFQRCG